MGMCEERDLNISLKRRQTSEVGNMKRKKVEWGGN
jgi:hypothetical protein